jgi:hypothetical protein
MTNHPSQSTTMPPGLKCCRIATDSPRVGQRGRQLAEQNFSFDAMAANYETLYREAIAAAR